MTRDELVLVAKDIATAHGLDPILVCAVVEQETEGTWNPLCIRFEPDFLRRYVEPILAEGKIKHDRLVSVSTEEFARCFSWGLLQVMGEVAREYGFVRPWLSELTIPAIGLDIGCKILSSKIAGRGGDVVRGLQAWNGGSNPTYATEVLARKPHY